MLPKHVRAWCRKRNAHWADDPTTKYALVLQAYTALGEKVPASVQSKAKSAATKKVSRKRKRAPDRPASHYCPISHELMTDPVIAPDGHSYDRPMLERWLRVNRTSPMTQQPIPVGFKPPRNHALRQAIQDFDAQEE